MARKSGSDNESKPRGRKLLPDPLYYLSNFQLVIAALTQRYADLLTPEERRFIEQFAMLPRSSQALLVRMVMRKGTLFRTSRLSYGEIGAPSAALGPLVETGCVEANPELNVGELQQLLTKAELLRYLAPPRLCRSIKKSCLVSFLSTQYPESRGFDSWCSDAGDRAYRLRVDHLCEQFRLMFFGNFHQNWSEFVLADLGIFRYEKIDGSLHSRPFESRAHIDAFQRLHECRRLLDAGQDLGTVAEAMPPAIVECDWLEERRQKLLFRIARALERQQDSTAALATYAQCAHRGARMRIIRMRERAHEWELARELCMRALQCVENEVERQQLGRILPRLNKKMGLPAEQSVKPQSFMSFDLDVDTSIAECAVERYVQRRLAQETRDVTSIHYVENGLVNALFGLLCWDAIFAPIRGAFFHEFQHGPADLSSAHFYQRRRREFSACFEELESESYVATIRQRFAEKAGIQSPFVAWGLLNAALLDLALRCFPAAHLRLWFRWIVEDICENRTGFPDLVQFWPHERRYRLIEVKGPGDRLQDNQRRLLEFCRAHRMPVWICYVRTRKIPA